jgi:AraC-like DNA-binding protein
VLLTSLVLIAGVFVAIGILQQPIDGPGPAANDNMRIYDPAFTEPTTRVGDAMEGYRAALEEAATFQPVAPARWLAQLAALLAEDGGCDIGQLAARCGVTAKHASRACKRWFGEPPVRLRQEGRPRRAIALLLDGASPVEAALDAGFSDQPHLARLLKQATGFTPARLVRS